MKKSLLLFAFLAFLALPSQGQSLTDSLLYHYNFNGNAQDVSGNGYHATVYGPIQGPDRFGNLTGAYVFDGIDDTISIPYDIKLSAPYPVTLSAWIFSSDGQGFFRTHWEEDVYYGYWLHHNNGGNIAVNFGDSGPVGPQSRRSKISDSTMVPGQWNHIVGVIRGPTDMTLCLNGQDAGGYYDGSGGTLAFNTENGRLGISDPTSQAGGVEFFQGSLDDVRYYNRDLSVEECMLLYNEELVSVDVASEPVGMDAFPVPADDKLFLTFRENYTQVGIRLFAADGRMALQTDRDHVPMGARIPVDVSNLPSGVYFLHIALPTKTLHHRVVVQH